jgi:hypothetical protein
MRLVTAAVALVATAVIPACTSGHQQHRPSLVVHLRLVAQHGRGLIVVGTGSVHGRVHILEASTRQVRNVFVPSTGRAVTLPIGRYLLTASIPDGACKPLRIVVGSEATLRSKLHCRDGIGTD